MNYIYREIKSQYTALRKTFDYITARKDELLIFYKNQSPKTLTYIGCGSSYYLCQSAEFSARVRFGKPATAMASGDLMLNYKSYLKTLEETLIIAPTRSGSTSEVLLALENIKSVQSVPVLAITCVVNTDLAKKADLTMELPWAFDESVCQTRTVTNLYMANLLILGYLCGDQRLIDDINLAINAGNSFIEEYEGKLKNIAEGDWHDVVVLADGEMQGIATEGALAFTEIARVPGRYYHLLDVRHGPMVLINNYTLVIMCLTSEGYEYQTALIADLVNKGATVITYSDILKDPISGVKLQISSGLKLEQAVRGIPFIFIAQALAYYKALQKGVDPDQPEGLDAWIKL
jgi:glutamine---fructose-6-phosphate transaminase (isomerizing)